ncbi:MAG: redoxin domain-containing protein [Saprospiraceae bacterium]|nr:redoxin domain-containing protein [Saprospiraceae bacterium]
MKYQSLLFFFWLFSLVIVTPFSSVRAQSSDSFTVYVFLLDECRICQEVAPELNKIYTLTKENNIGFVGYFPNLSSNDAGIQKFRKKYKVQYTLSTDFEKEVAKRFAATTLPEVVMWNETKNELVYRGLINNLFYAPGKRRHKITQHYLKDAIFAVQGGKYPVTKTTDPIGCFINYSENPF